MKYEIINNFLEQNEFLNLKDIFTHHNFPWFLKKGINVETTAEDSNYQFTHTFYYNNIISSNYFGQITSLIEKLKVRSLIRIKANLIPKNDKIIEHGYHVDYNFADSKTAVFYINSNNGYTKFTDGFISNSEENKIIIFNSTEKHTGTTCTDANYRIAININYF
jgi:hypothetical protein